MNAFLLERSLGVLYILLGPFAWGVFAFAMIKGRRRLSLLKRPLQALPDPPPRVSVLVPVKDEAEQIRRCLASVLNQDYPNFHTIAIDDRSIDGTGEILDEIARPNTQLTVLHIKPSELPAGWAGKPHALHVGMQHANGDWLLFVDSDVELAPDGLRGAIALAETKRFDLVSLLPRMVCESFWEKLMMPLAGAATSAMFLLPFSNYNELPRIAFANGQFLCIRRSAYEAIGGHEAVRDTLSEDIAIARRLKIRGMRPRLSIGSDFASTRMYDSLGALVRGWSRNFYGGSAGRIGKALGGIVFVIFSCFSAYAALVIGMYRISNPNEAWGAIAWIEPSLIHFAIMTAALALIYKWTGNAKRFAFLFPLGGVILIAIWLRTMKMCLSGNVEWRGTRYAFRRGRDLTTRVM